MQKGEKEKYQVEQLAKVFAQLSLNRTGISAATLSETLTAIGRMVVWGEQHNSDIFDYICEQRVLDVLIDIYVQAKDKDVINTIIAFLNMLLTNLRQPQIVNYLLSHSCIIKVSQTKFNSMGHEVAEYFVNFLKGLSRKVTPDTLHLFYNKKFPHFPLLMQTIRFFNHPEPLVRTTCRNIVLGLAKLQRVEPFVADFPFCTYFIHECNFLREYWRIIDKIIDTKEDYELDHLDSILQDHEEILIYLDDLLSLDHLSHAFLNAFINECLIPLMHSLGSIRKEYYSIKLSLLILHILLKHLTRPAIAEAIALVIFGKYYPKQLSEALFSPVPLIKSYDKTWRFKGFWDLHHSRIVDYSLQQYSNAHQDATHSISPITSSLKSNSQPESAPSCATSQLHPTSSSQKAISAVFGRADTNQYTEEVKKIQRIFGLSILSNNPPSISTSSIIADLKESLPNLDLTACEENQSGESILSFLRSKDDTLMMLTLTLLTTLLRAKTVSNEVLRFCRLSVTPLQVSFDSITRVERIIVSCLRIFTNDPVCYRICTYAQACKVVQLLVPIYKGSVAPDVIAALKKGMGVCVERVGVYVLDSKDCNAAAEYYNQILDQKGVRRDKSLKVLGLITEEPQENIFKAVYQELPRSYQEQMLRDMWMYLLLRDLHLLITSKEEPQQAPKEATSPEIISSKYQEGQNYDPSGVECTPAQYKFLTDDTYTPCELIFLPKGMVLGASGKVIQICRYVKTVLLADKSDPRKLLMAGNKLAISLSFQESKTPTMIRRYFEDAISFENKLSYLKIVKEVELYRAYAQK